MRINISVSWPVTKLHQDRCTIFLYSYMDNTRDGRISNFQEETCHCIAPTTWTHHISQPIIVTTCKESKL
jgi:hypothetical protein